MMNAQDYLQTARAELIDARDRLISEIAAYPTPIAGCDEQFNHLLCERKRVIAALKALDADDFIPTPRRLVA